MLKPIPVYVIDGLLESGKTTFIKDTISSDDFFKKGTTLILSGEEGEIEYEKEFLDKYNCVIKYFDSQDEFTSLNLSKLVSEIKPSRIVVELNGMWDLAKIEFPMNFKVYQFITFINFDTFEVYFANMRQKFLDMVKQSDVAVFINVIDDADKEKLETYSASFRLTNQNAQYMVMDEQGRLSDAFKLVLPYDIDADVIEIKDNDYGIWYIDTFDNKESYQGKVVEFNSMVVMSEKLPKNTFIAGRLAMTCCDNDIQLYGHLCINNSKEKIKDRDFVHIIAKINYQYSEEYNEEECVLYPISIKKIPPLKDPILDLTK